VVGWLATSRRCPTAVGRTSSLSHTKACERSGGRSAGLGWAASDIVGRVVMAKTRARLGRQRGRFMGAREVRPRARGWQLATNRPVRFAAAARRGRRTFELTSCAAPRRLRVPVTLFAFYVVVIVLGVLSMGFQLLASRLLNPHFGSSII